MEENFDCSLCSRAAVQCCLCSTPRTYLCKACIPQHTTSKSICHSLMPVSTPAYVTKENLAEHNSRMTALGKLRGQLDVASAQLPAERRALDQVVQDFYKSQQQRLDEVIYAVYMDISRYYESLQIDIDTFKQDLYAADQSPYVSEVARKYIETGFHAPQPSAFLEVMNEMNSRIQISALGDQLGAQNCLLDAISRWKSAPCTCSDCYEIKEALIGKPPLSSSQDLSYWCCPQCSYQYNYGMACQYCPFSYESASGQAYASPTYWKCTACKFEYNQALTCEQCGKYPDNGEMASASAIATPNPCWTCSQCQYEYNLQNTTCIRCQYKNPSLASTPRPAAQADLESDAIEPAAKHQSATFTSPRQGQFSAAVWTCRKCKFQNKSTDRKCQKCITTAKAT